MPIPDVLRRLLEAPGPSGYERPAAAAFREACAEFAEVSQDTVGSTVARVPGTAEGPSLAVVGHVDEIGLLVQHIDDGGFLWFRTLGGWDPQVLVGQRVIVSTKDGPIPGLVGRKPIHVLQEDARKEAAKIDDLHIDIGARDGDDARERVRIGDSAVLDAQPLEYPNDRVVSRALDNRVGCYVAYEVARRLAADGGAGGDVYAVAVTQEERGAGGSTTTAYALEPDVAVVVDGTWCTAQPGMEEKKFGRFRMGDGAVISRGQTLHPDLFELLAETADAEGIPYSIEATAGLTHTDADAFYKSRRGVPTAIVQVPMRYLHTPVEMIDLGDLEAAIALVTAFARRLPADLDLRR